MHLVHINQITSATTRGFWQEGKKNQLCVAVHVFIHCPRNVKNFQIVRLRDAATGVCVIGNLIIGNADGLRKS